MGRQKRVDLGAEGVSDPGLININTMQLDAFVMVEAVALLYADNMTDSMAKAISETERRRAIQQPYNEKNGILSTAAGKKACNSILSLLEPSRKLKQDGPDADLVEVVGKAANALENDPDAGLALEALPELIDQHEAKMKEEAKSWTLKQPPTFEIELSSCGRRWQVSFVQLRLRRLDDVESAA